MGGHEEREEFARRYRGPVEAYLRARRAGTRYLQDVEDGVQELFLECFRQGGFLERAAEGRPGGFRAFLYGAARNVALRIERRAGREKARQAPGDDDLEARAIDETSLSLARSTAPGPSSPSDNSPRRGAVSATFGFVASCPAFVREPTPKRGFERDQNEEPDRRFSL